MKKILFFVVSVLFTINAFAQEFYPVAKVSQTENSLMAFVEGDTICDISLADYLNMYGCEDDFYYIKYQNSTGSFAIFAHKDDFVSELLEVDSLGFDGEKVEVYFTNGTVYKASRAWASVLIGQKVQHVVINNSDRVFERYASLIDEPKYFVHNVPEVKKDEAKIESNDKPINTPEIIDSEQESDKKTLSDKEKKVKKSKQRVATYGNVKLIEE